jgi:hypothetical protein
MGTRAYQRPHKVWQIDMGDGTWAVACTKCGAICRDTRAIANSAASLHLLAVASVGAVVGA